MTPNIIQRADQLMPDVAILRAAADESERRAVRSRTLELLEYEPSGSEPSLVPEGSVTVFLGRPGSSLLREIRACIISRDGRDAELYEQVRRQYEGRSLMPLASAVELLIRQPVFADVTLGRFTLASNLFVPDDMPVAVFPLPYTGGELPVSGLQLLERPREPSGATLEGFAVRHRPVLTEVEMEALRLLPEENRDLNIGKAANCYAITAVVLVGLVMGATYACPGSHPRIHLDPEAIRTLGPDASVRELLALRRAALERRQS